MPENVSSVRMFFSSTVPISCGSGCRLTFKVARAAGTTVSNCKFTLIGVDEGYIDVKAVPTSGVGSRSAAIQFDPLLDYVTPEQDIWDLYQLQSIPV